MKKLLKKYQEYMIGPVIYKTLVRLLIGAILCLLWAKFGNTTGHFTVLNYPFFILGIMYLGLLWMNYLQMDGVRGLDFFERGIRYSRKFLTGTLDKAPKKYQGMSDYANQERSEKAEEFDGLSDEEQLLCTMVANLIAGLFFLLPSIISMVL